MSEQKKNTGLNLAEQHSAHFNTALDVVSAVSAAGLVLLPRLASADMQKAGADIGGVTPDVAASIYQAMAVSADAAWGGKLFEVSSLLDSWCTNRARH